MKHNCNLTTCRYNENGKCENEEKRKECVEVARKVLCLEDKENEENTNIDTSIEDGVVEVKTVDKNGIQITMAGKVDKIAKTGINWTDFYNRVDDE